MQGPKTHVAKDQPMIFKLRMRNEMRTTLPHIVPLELKVDPGSNLNNLSVRMSGLRLGTTFLNFNGNTPIESDLVIYRGQEHYEYEPLRISLRSKCEAAWPRIALKNEKSIELYNVGSGNNAAIRFLKPCPRVRWASDLLLDQTFIINESSKNSMEVVIYNVDEIRSLFEEKENGRLESVKLRYREEGEEWEDAVMFDGQKADFVDSNVVEESGYLRLEWNAKDIVKAGNYDIKVECKCKKQDDLPEEYNEFSTNIIRGIIDKIPPSVYGKTSIEEKNNIISPDNEVIVKFSEELTCTKPHKFLIEISTDGKKLLDNSNLQILCASNEIRFYIEPVSRHGLYGKEVQMKLVNILDLAGNVMNPDSHDPYILRFEFTGKDRLLLQKVDIKKERSCDCEDKAPPSISIHSVPVYNHPDFPSVPFLREEFFSTADEAKSFLRNNLLISDECAKDLKVDISCPLASCDETIFDVTVTDPRCGDVNENQTITKSYLLRVDSNAPMVSVGFRPTSRPLFYDPEKNFMVVEENHKNFMNTKFWHKVEDDCSQKVKVDVTVMSNEQSFDKPMSKVVKRRGVEQENQLQVYVEPSSCKAKEENEDYFCEWDSDIPIRFYEILIKATDYGGHVGNATATVVVVPKMRDKESAFKNSNEVEFYYEKHFQGIIAKESERYVLETAMHEWDIL